MPNNQTEIKQLEALLNSGAKSTSVDGLSVQLDHAAIRKRIAELKATDTTSIAAGKARPRVSKLKMGGAW